MLTSGPEHDTRLTTDMLPLIEAVVFRKVVMTAAGWTVFWAVMALVSSAPYLRDSDGAIGHIGYATLATCFLLMGMGLFCLVWNSAVLLMHDAITVGIIGVILFAIAILRIGELRQLKPDDRFNPIFMAFIGLVQIIWAKRQ